MQIPAISPTHSGKRFASAEHAPSGPAASSPATLESQLDDVLLHDPSALEVGASLDLQTLLTLMRGMLETVEGRPLELREALRTNSRLLDSISMPSWLQAAHHALAAVQQNLLRLHAQGLISSPGTETIPFALDMQLLNPAFVNMGQAVAGSFTLGIDAGGFAGAHVSFTLLPGISVDSAARSLSTRPALPDSLFHGCPLFAQFLLGRQSDILCIAARLLPSGSGHVSRPHQGFSGDGSYVTQEETSGNPHCLDVSA
jgi:hypothetical protein